MGIYVYKVTGKTKTLKNGTKANIAVFAYKPWFGWGNEAQKENNRMYRESGCYGAQRYVETGKTYTGFVVLGEEGEVAVEMDRGTFYDSEFETMLQRQREVA